MTIKELKELIEDLPDDMIVLVHQTYNGHPTTIYGATVDFIENEVIYDA